LLLVVEKFQDHAPGQLIVKEARGMGTEPFKFGLATLGGNYGVIACSKSIHPTVLEAVRKAVAEAKDKATWRVQGVSNL